MDLRLKFNEDVYNYDRFRPSYPSELFTDIFNYAQCNDGREGLEIGIGTGQATLPFLERGYNVTAIELGDRLSRYVKRKFEKFNNFRVIHADFMEFPIASGSIDLAYCATAFHWLPPGEGYKKLLRILRPDGVAALFWNHPFPNRKDDISNRVNRRIYDKYRPSNKEIVESSEKDCQKRLAELERFGFREIALKLYHRVRTLPSDAYISLLNTYSDHRALPTDIKTAFEKDMKASLDQIGGRINIYDTIDLYLARK